MNLISILIDAVIVLIAYLFIRHSIKVGAAKTIVQLAGFIIVVVLIFTVGNVLTDYVYDSFVKEKIVVSVDKNITENVAEYKEGVKDALPEYAVNVGEFIGIDVEKQLTESQDRDTRQMAENLEKNILMPVIKSILKLVLTVIFLIVSVILIRALSKLTLVINKIPLIGTANKGLGLVFGLIEAVFVLMVFCSLFKIVCEYVDWYITPQILQKTYIFKFLCELNFMF